MLIQIYELFGRLVVYSTIILFIFALLTAVLLFISLRRQRFYMPNFTVALLLFFRGFFKAVFRLLRFDDTAIDRLYIDLSLPGLEGEFFAVPPGERIVFFPQCLRSVDCIGRLTSDGIVCEKCGRCRLSEASKLADDLGYRFFIVPGSSFIKRAVNRYRPGAVLGIGCLTEIKDGVEMIQRHGLPVYAIQLESAGCINTTVDWDRVFDTMRRFDGEKVKRGAG